MVTFFNALQAILWCLAVQKALMKVEWPERLLALPAAGVEYAKGDESKTDPTFRGIRIRMGIHTGSPSCRRNPVTGRMDYFGPVVNRSARVADSAHGGQIVCTHEVVARLDEAKQSGEWTESVVVEDLGEYPYKGISELVRVYQLSPPDLVGRNPFPGLRIHTPKEKTDVVAPPEES